MANNYNQFSEVIPRLSAKEASWLEMTHRTRREADDHGDFQMEIATDTDKNRNWKRHAWIYAEESGSVDDVASMVQEFLKLFRPNEFFHIAWSYSCSKPRVGEFGGGAVFITATSQKWMSDSSFIEEQKAAWHKQQAKKGKRNAKS